MSANKHSAPLKRNRWNLQCVGIFAETGDVKTFHFVPSENLQKGNRFLHKPGQFIALQFLSGKNRFSRTYTISSPPSRPATITLTIKRDPHGLVSRYMHDYVRVGDIVPAIGPAGEFNIRDIKPAQKLLLLSGGSGITPGMSVLREIYDTANTDIDVNFIHSARTPQDIIFHKELEWMSSDRPNIKVSYICETGADNHVEPGLLNTILLQKLAPDFLDRTIMTCGPAPYMDAVKSILNRAGFDMASYHEESFGDPSQRNNPENAEPGNIRFADPYSSDHIEKIPEPSVSDAQAQSGGDNGEHVIHFLSSGKQAPYQPGETLLSVASRTGIAIPTNCQMGLCGTCKVKLESGNVTMEDEEGLTDEDRNENYVLTCCGRGKGQVRIHI